MPKPHRRQILELTGLSKKLTLPYEDSAERVVHEYTIKFNFGIWYGSFKALPGEVVSVHAPKSGILEIRRTLAEDD